MKLDRRRLHRSLCAFVVGLSLVASSQAKTKGTDVTTLGVHIGNFGKISANYFRGAQPKGSDYRDLAALGVKTVIDLTNNGEADPDEQRFVEGAGMAFHRIPMTTSDRPADAAVSQFLKLVTDPANQPVYVHCQGGRHRTGVMTAVYRMTQDGWSADRAYDEMKQFNFEGFPGHPTLKKFVYEYYSKLDHSMVPDNGKVAVAPK